MNEKLAEIYLKTKKNSTVCNQENKTYWTYVNGSYVGYVQDVTQWGLELNRVLYINDSMEPGDYEILFE